MHTRSNRSRCLRHAMLLFTLVTVLGATGCSNLPRNHWWQLWRKKPAQTATSTYSPDSMVVPPPPPDVLGGVPGGEALPPTGTPPEPGMVTDTEPIRRPAAGTVSELRTVTFDYNSADISQSSQAVLDANAQWIAAHPDLQIQIEGHTDARGTTEYNMSLGDRRAKSVKAYLMSKGIQGDRLHTTTYGEERPMDPRNTEEAYAQNRRAQFLVY